MENKDMTPILFLLIFFAGIGLTLILQEQRFDLGFISGIGLFCWMVWSDTE